jgi:predicted kinase
MQNTVENSPWHREANVAVHTDMTIEKYLAKFYHNRTERQRVLTLMALLFHDFGKPEAEETLEKKDEPGVFYRRYAGHEPISGNEFLSFMCDNHELRQLFFDQGFTWKDIRIIKVMIEHHLPYGLKNEQKRQKLKQMIEATLEGDETCFYDMLRADCHGRISDDHDAKKQAVEEWIENFQWVFYKERTIPKDAPELIVMVGISGAGKSTLIKTMDPDWVVFSEDKLRMDYAFKEMPYSDYVEMEIMTEAEKYQHCWNFCHLNKESKFDQFSAAAFGKALESGKTVVLDRMNQGRKARGKFIEAAKAKGYKIRSIELYVSEATAKARQKTRADKKLSDYRVHQIAMQLETPWLGAEVDKFSIYIPS